MLFEKAIRRSYAREKHFHSFADGIGQRPADRWTTEGTPIRGIRSDDVRTIKCGAVSLRNCEKSLRTNRVMEQGEDDRIGQAELARFGRNGRLFCAYGMVLPNLYFGPCDVFQLRFAVVSDAGLDGAVVRVKVPEGWQIAPKANFHWDDEPEFQGREASVTIPGTPPFRHGVAAFNVLLPGALTGSNQVLLSRDIAHPDGGDLPGEMLIRAGEDKEEGTISAFLNAGGREQELVLPVRLVKADAFDARLDGMLRGQRGGLLLPPQTGAMTKDSSTEFDD